MQRIAAAAALAFFSHTASGQTSPVPASPRIITSGEAQVRVAPDRATILVGVQNRGATAAAASAANAKTQKAVLDTLRSLGLTPDQLTTQTYSVYPETQYQATTGTSRVTGYVVSNVVRVELKRVDQVSPVIDAALAKGANQINSIQFSSSTAADARRRAMADAVADARADADVLARAAGGSLGPLIELTSNSAPIRPMFEGATMAVAKDRAQTPIEPGEQILTANVSVTWTFIPGPGK
jgi:uncharacterized protein YggE